MKLEVGVVIVLLASVSCRGDQPTQPSPVTVTAIDGEFSVARTNRVTFQQGEPANLTLLIMKLGHSPFYKYREITLVRARSDGTVETNRVDVNTMSQEGKSLTLQEGDVLMFHVRRQSILRVDDSAREMKTQGQ